LSISLPALLPNEFLGFAICLTPRPESGVASFLYALATLRTTGVKLSELFGSLDDGIVGQGRWGVPRLPDLRAAAQDSDLGTALLGIFASRPIADDPREPATDQLSHLAQCRLKFSVLIGLQSM
jgi:hypothetical protein